MLTFLLPFLILWQTVYTISYAITLHNRANKKGALFIASLSALSIVTFLIFLIKNIF